MSSWVPSITCSLSLITRHGIPVCHHLDAKTIKYQAKCPSLSLRWEPKSQRESIFCFPVVRNLYTHHTPPGIAKVVFLVKITSSPLSSFVHPYSLRTACQEVSLCVPVCANSLFDWRGVSMWCIFSCQSVQCAAVLASSSYGCFRWLVPSLTQWLDNRNDAL